MRHHDDIELLSLAKKKAWAEGFAAGNVTFRDALKLIEEFGGKTLIMASGEPHERQAYSLGAHRAFEQCAGIARDALTKSA